VTIYTYKMVGDYELTILCAEIKLTLTSTNA